MRRAHASLLAAALAGCNREIVAIPGDPAPGPAVHEAVVRVPPKLMSVEVPRANAQPLRVPCATCHSLRGDRPLPGSASELDEFHRGLVVRHGGLSCAACHSPAAPAERLHLADGTELPFPEVLQLCSQCHGPQRRDFEHGAHGGMRGHWDRSRGPRERNSCVDCHDPHAPPFVGGQPLPRTRDRGVEVAGG